MRRAFDLIRSKADVGWLVGLLLALGAGGAYLAMSLVGEGEAVAGGTRVEMFTTVVTNEVGETQTLVTRRLVTDTATVQSVGTVVRPGTTVFGPVERISVAGPTQTQTNTVTQTETSVRTVTDTLTNTVTETVRDTVTVVQTETVTVADTVTVVETVTVEAPQP